MFEFPRVAQPLIDSMSIAFTPPTFKRFVVLLAGAALYEPAPRSSDPAPEGRTDSSPPRPRSTPAELSFAPPGRLESAYCTPRVALRSTRDYSRPPLRGEINARAQGQDLPAIPDDP